VSSVEEKSRGYGFEIPRLDARPTLGMTLIVVAPIGMTQEEVGLTSRRISGKLFLRLDTEGGEVHARPEIGES